MSTDTIRTRNLFLWLPMRLEGEWRWLRRATVEEHYQIYFDSCTDMTQPQYDWFPRRWVTNLTDECHTALEIKDGLPVLADALVFSRGRFMANDHTAAFKASNVYHITGLPKPWHWRKWRRLKALLRAFAGSQEMKSDYLPGSYDRPEPPKNAQCANALKEALEEVKALKERIALLEIYADKTNKEWLEHQIVECNVTAAMTKPWQWLKRMRNRQCAKALIQILEGMEKGRKPYRSHSYAEGCPVIKSPTPARY